jgi:hypothetical protein
MSIATRLRPPAGREGGQAQGRKSGLAEGEFFRQYASADQRNPKRFRSAHRFNPRPGACGYTTYVEEAVFPPLPVQSVWKNSPRGLSTRSYMCAPK